jgi:putative ABC transport system permease protein
MQLFENIQLALEGLKSNKMRALLTMLGIIIGVGSVIGIVTVGDAMTASVSSSMQSLGATNIIVTLREKDSRTGSGPGGVGRGGGAPSGGGAEVREGDLITDDMIEKYTELYGDRIDAISLSASAGQGQAKDGRFYANITLTGTNDGYALSNNVDLIEGRYIKENDLKAYRNVTVVSDKLVSNMFATGQSALGEEIKVYVDDNIYTFSIIGVYKHEDSIMGMLGGGTASDKDVRTDLYIPITTAKVITSGDRGYQSLTVMASSGVSTQKFTDDTIRFFNTYYDSNTRFEVNAIGMQSMISSMTEILGTLSIAIAVIAGISLVVGGVGVMNIMLVSVTERTKEIGTRKALGAKNSAIRIQFVVEAMIICTIGGIIGVLTGVGLGYLASALLGSSGLPSVFIVVVAVLFSMLIGVFFGYYPANKAARLDPIEALRYE